MKIIYDIKTAITTIPQGTYAVKLLAVNQEKAKKGKEVKLLSFVFETQASDLGAGKGAVGFKIEKKVSANLDRRGDLLRLLSDLSQQEIPFPANLKSPEGLSNWISKLIGRNYRAAILQERKINSILSLGSVAPADEYPF
jgi:hypothetical protein